MTLIEDIAWAVLWCGIAAFFVVLPAFLWLSDRHKPLKRFFGGVGLSCLVLCLIGILGVTALADVTKDIDFTREYGVLIRRFANLKSEDPAWPRRPVQSTVDVMQPTGHSFPETVTGTVQIPDDSGVKLFTGPVIVCFDDGRRYVHVLTFFEQSNYLPTGLRSHGRLDVKQIVYVSEKRTIGGYYGGAQSYPAYDVALTARVVDVTTSRLIAVFRTVGSDPGSVSVGLTTKSDGPSASQNAAQHLRVWVRSEEARPSPWYPQHSEWNPLYW